MPVRSKTLLAGAAALVGLSFGGVGCQSIGLRSSCSSGGCAAGQVVHHGGPAVASLQRPVRRPIFGGYSETQVVAAYPTSTPVATAMRPVASHPMYRTDNSTWSPVQRVSAEGPTIPIDSSTGRPVVIDRPMPMATLPSLGPPDYRPVPAPSFTLSDELPRPMGKPDDGLPKNDSKTDPKKDKDVLPNPRKSTGYPALPPVGVTHPIDAPREFQKRSLSAYIIEPPDVLSIDAPADLLSPDKSVVLSGPALVRPDGTIGLGTLGSVFVAGLTLDQAKYQIARVIQTLQPKEDLDTILRKFKLDVAAFNSKFFYVISDGAGYGEQVTKVPIYGNETVLDAVAAIQGLPAVASKKRIWLARATPDGYGAPQILPIDWRGVAMRGSAATNYQIFPGDRLYIQSDRLLNFNSALGKVLAPVERVLGVTLLGSSVVNSIKNGGNGGGNNLR